MVKYINRSKGYSLCNVCDREDECYWFRPLNLYLCVECLKRELKHRGIVDSVNIFEEEIGYRENKQKGGETKGIKKEMDVIRKELRNDGGLYIAWQSNIAMAFMDACHRKGIKHEKLHEVANHAAKNFLNLLIKG